MADDCVGKFLTAVGTWIYEFQTLITGLLAIGAAWIAANIAKGQLEAAKEQIRVAREQIAAGTAEADQVRERRLRRRSRNSARHAKLHLRICPSCWIPACRFVASRS